MTEFFNFALLGLGLGALYGLFAQGIVVIHRGSGVVNFAHAAMATLSAYVFVELDQRGWPLWLAMISAVAVSAAFGLLMHVGVMRPLANAAPLTKLVATLGVLSVVQAGLIGWPIDLGSQQSFVDSFLPTDRVSFTDDVGVSQERLWLLGIALCLTAGLWAFFKYARAGAIVRAAAENPEAASALGRSPDAIAAANWTVGSALAGLAGVLIVPVIGFSVLQMLVLLVPALAAALLGRFKSFPLTLLGGLFIGVAESVLISRADWIPDVFTGPGWSKSVPFIVIVVVLAFQGTSLPSRSAILERLPRVGLGRIRPTTLIVVFAACFVLISGAGVFGYGGLSPNTVAALMQTLAVGTIALSLVVVAGYAGQLSLAQWALAGVGAYVAARTAAGGDLVGIGSLGTLPMELAIVLAVAVTVPVGILVGLTALRTRGVNLAIATLGLGLLIERVVLGNADYTGGVAGTQLEPQTLFGISIDSVTDQRRYGVFSLIVFTLCALIVVNVRRGRTGRRLLAVRANERAAASLGISVVAAKLYAFAVASGIAALGGVLLAFRSRSVIFSDYNTTNSIQLVVQTVLGGVGFVGGAIFSGAIAASGFVVHLVDDWFSIDELLVALIAGVALVLNLALFPDGVVSMQARKVGAALDYLTEKVRPRKGPDKVPVISGAGPRERVPQRTLRVEGLSVNFGGVVALRDVSLELVPGEVHGVIGPNGAGKTTLIDAATGFTRPSAGKISVDGNRIDNVTAALRARLGVSRSFQSLELFEDMTIGDNIRTAADGRNRLSYLTDLLFPRHAALPGTAIAAIEEFELADDLDKFPSDLSFGKRRTVGIARAVAARPSVLLLDEPAAGLGERETEELGHLIRRLADEWGIAIMLVEHDVSLVFSMCDRVTAMDFGEVIAVGEPELVQNDPAVIAAYLGVDDDSQERQPEVEAPGPGGRG